MAPNPSQNGSFHKLLSSLAAPEKPGDKEYTQLVEKLSKHFAPVPSEIVKRFKFHTTIRKPGESVTSYMTELRSIAKCCNFEGSLETMLRDRIVCGINNAAIQCLLLSEKDLTYKKALKIAQGMESAAQNVKELCPTDTLLTSLPVHHVTNSKQTAAVCYHCGKPGRLAPACRHKDTVCRKCGKIGQSAAVRRQTNLILQCSQ